MAFLRPLYKSTATPRTLKYLFLNLGILGGAPAITYYFFGPGREVEKLTISDRITQNNRTVLGSDAKTWGIKLHVYNSSDELQHKLNNKLKNVTELKNWCKETLNKDSNNDDYSIAEKLCTTPTNREKLNRFHWRIIDDGDETRWKSKEKLYNNTENKSIKINQGGKINWKEIQKWCGNTSEKEIKDGDNIYNEIKRLCTQRNFLSKLKR